MARASPTGTLKILPSANDNEANERGRYHLDNIFLLFITSFPFSMRENNVAKLKRLTAFARMAILETPRDSNGDFWIRIRYLFTIDFFFL